jgi:hypothetical protein
MNEAFWSSLASWSACSFTPCRPSGRFKKREVCRTVLKR